MHPLGMVVGGMHTQAECPVEQELGAGCVGASRTPWEPDLAEAAGSQAHWPGIGLTGIFLLAVPARPLPPAALRPAQPPAEDATPAGAEVCCGAGDGSGELGPRSKGWDVGLPSALGGGLKGSQA